MNTRPLRSSWTLSTDKLAMEGAHTEQSDANVSYQEKATITKAIMMPSQEKDAYNLFSRSEQVMMVRLKTGHIRMHAHMHKRLK